MSSETIESNAFNISLNDKIIEFETFVNSKLKEDLKNAYEAREKVKSELVEYTELKNSIEILKDDSIQSNGLNSALDIGCNFFVDAHVRDVSKIIVNIGLDIYIEYTLDEALAFIEKKLKMLEHHIEFLSSKCAQIEGIITLSISCASTASGMIAPSPQLIEAAEDAANAVVAQVAVPSTDMSGVLVQSIQDSLLRTLKCTD